MGGEVELSLNPSMEHWDAVDGTQETSLELETFEVLYHLSDLLHT